MYGIWSDFSDDPTAASQTKTAQDYDLSSQKVPITY